jgi:bifunctional non-homologous end joining protein LigD
MKRYPGGVEEAFFYEKNCPVHRPDWVQTAPVWSAGNNRWMNYCLIQDLPTLVWASNLASLELHTSLSLAPDVLCPTMAVFDLDPGAPATIVECCEVALRLRETFTQLGLKACAKTSGSKGLQVYVPLNSPVTYEQTKGFARELARRLERAHPNLVVSDMKKVLRTGKVFVDWSQNDDHKTTVSVYSLRAKEQPTASTPVSWDEVEACWRKKDAQRLVFTSDKVLVRVEDQGDLFEPVLKLVQKLPPLEALAELDATGGGSPLPARKKKAPLQLSRVTARPRRRSTSPKRAMAKQRQAA